MWSAPRFGHKTTLKQLSVFNRLKATDQCESIFPADGPNRSKFDLLCGNN